MPPDFSDDEFEDADSHDGDLIGGGILSDLIRLSAVYIDLEAAERRAISEASESSFFKIACMHLRLTRPKPTSTPRPATKDLSCQTGWFLEELRDVERENRSLKARLSHGVSNVSGWDHYDQQRSEYKEACRVMWRYKKECELLWALNPLEPTAKWSRSVQTPCAESETDAYPPAVCSSGRPESWSRTSVEDETDNYDILSSFCFSPPPPPIINEKDKEHGNSTTLRLVGNRDPPISGHTESISCSAVPPATKPTKEKSKGKKQNAKSYTAPVGGPQAHDGEAATDVRDGQARGGALLAAGDSCRGVVT